MKPKLFIACLIASLTLFSCGEPALRTEVIAHRGYWNTEGSAQNSIAALVKADSIRVWGSECDVYLAADSVLMVNHDRWMLLDGDTLLMARTPSTQLQRITLANGEPMPTFAAYLDAFKTCLHTRLVIELKSPGLSDEESKLLAAIAVTMVERAELQHRVEYIAFGRAVAEEVIRLDPQARVSYLNGELTPAELKELGYTGLDYHINVMRDNEAWFAEARELGLTVNVWTVNDEETMRWLIGQGADYITTDEPELLQAVLESVSKK